MYNYVVSLYLETHNFAATARIIKQCWKQALLGEEAIVSSYATIYTNSYNTSV